MPATLAPPITKQEIQKPPTSAPIKKRRIVRRRGRARGEIDSEDEIERAIASDASNTEDDDSDSLDSATEDSDTEPVLDDTTVHDRTNLTTLKGSSPQIVGQGDVSPFFAPSGSWSEMVMDETVNGPAELPVVDFADFRVQKSSKLARKPKKAPKSNTSLDSCATPADQPNIPPSTESLHATSPTTENNRIPQHRRQTLPSHSARQLYQQKLVSDPSFVPTIGNFWGHDDRLIDAELRNLSGWWRGRGMRERGRGRGRVDGIQGRSGNFGYGRPDSSVVENEVVPPVDKTWTHDGFEEMKKRDEQRRAELAAVRQAQSSPKRGGFVGRGRGNFIQGRGRGGYSRGGFSSPARSRTNSPLILDSRARFAMKPELMWTKQHEAFLFFDSTLKPRSGQTPGFRVRFPGHRLLVIRVSSSVPIPPQLPKSKATDQTDCYVVRLPKRIEAEKDLITADPIDSTSESFKDAFVIDQESPATTEISPTNDSMVQEDESSQSEIPPEREDQPMNGPLEPPVDANTDLLASPTHERPVLPPLQTTFTPPPPPPPPQPVSQPSPAYGSPYGYALPLPPGIAMSSDGVPYELATGRPVYLQAPTMYSRPIMHGHYMLPGHMHHHSLSAPSPDFLSHPAPHTPSMNGFIDPATGTPIFAFPRQTSRIEIRAPGESLSSAGAKVSTKAPPPLASNLRPNSASFQPSTRLNTESSDGSGYFLPSSTPSDTPLPSYESQRSTTTDDATVTSSVIPHYYPQHYYYPEPYGYSQYMDMSHVGQPYPMYGIDQAPAQGTVYY